MEVFYGQATKSRRWMPWRRMAMKDVANCDKLRRAVTTGFDPEISEWENPSRLIPGYLTLNT